MRIAVRSVTGNRSMWFYSDFIVEETVVLDPPGQPELTIHHMALPRILYRLEKLGYRVRLLPVPPIHAAD